jgi:hypothetical protein
MPYEKPKAGKAANALTSGTVKVASYVCVRQTRL